MGQGHRFHIYAFNYSLEILCEQPRQMDFHYTYLYQESPSSLLLQVPLNCEVADYIVIRLLFLMRTARIKDASPSFQCSHGHF